MNSLLNLDSISALLTLTGMEIVLGIDNIIFIAILVEKLPKEKQGRARRLGIGLALITRLALLFSITWVMGLTAPLFAVFGREFSGRDLILILGGLFLVAKATWEIHDKLEVSDGEAKSGAPGRNGAQAFSAVLFQIILLDIVFSLDSVITAVGMAQQIWIMVVAMVAAVAVMLLAAGAISDFVMKHPTLKILALSFLLLIGVTLTAEGMGNHIPKGYIYFAMAFSLGVEMLNLAYRKNHTPVELHEPRLK